MGWEGRVTGVGESESGVPNRCSICGGGIKELHPFKGGPSVLRCGGCRAERLFPFPTEEEIRGRYDGYEGTKTDLGGARHLVKLARATIEHFVQLAGPGGRSPGETTYLEVGFGNGSSLLAATEYGFRTFGVDLDPTAPGYVKGLAEELGLPVPTMVTSFDALPAVEGGFGLVKASQVIEHVADPHAFLGSVAALQRPGGVLWIDCPNNDAWFWQVKNRIRSWFGREDFWNALKLGEHLWGHTVPSLTRLLEAAEYKVVCCEDYSVADERVQPELAHWYPKMLPAVRASVRNRRPLAVLKAGVRVLDVTSSRLAGRGMGLFGVGRRRG